jgi:hypothetical protein
MDSIVGILLSHSDETRMHVVIHKEDEEQVSSKPSKMAILMLPKTTSRNG